MWPGAPQRITYCVSSWVTRALNALPPFTFKQLATISMQKELGLSSKMGLACSLKIQPVFPYSPMHPPEEEKSIHGVPDIIISGTTWSSQLTSHVLPRSQVRVRSRHMARLCSQIPMPHTGVNPARIATSVSRHPPDEKTSTLNPGSCLLLRRWSPLSRLVAMGGPRPMWAKSQRYFALLIVMRSRHSAVDLE